MKLIKILDRVNQIEKGPFLKLLDSTSNKMRESRPEIEELLKKQDGRLKDADSESLTELFEHVSEEFLKSFEDHLCHNTHRLDIFFNIFARDGNSILSRDWLKTIFESELKNNIDAVESFNLLFKGEKSELDVHRKRDYLIYKACVETAHDNHVKNNRDPIISRNENYILNTLSSQLGLSSDDVSALRYLVSRRDDFDIDESIQFLKEIGVLFYSRRLHRVFVPDEIIDIIRKVCGKPIADKYFRRILRQLKDPELNRVARLHRLKADSRESKIVEIVKRGINARAVLSGDMFHTNASITDKKDRLTEIITKGLDIELKRTGATIEQKIENLFNYFNNLSTGGGKPELSTGGFHTMIEDIKQKFNNLEERIRTEFEIQKDVHLDVNTLIDLGITPLDVLNLLSNKEIADFREQLDISKKGNPRNVIIDKYTDTDELYIVNYELLASRDINGLRERGLTIKEAELGSKFEEVTAKILEDLKLNVDNPLRNEINNKKNRIDILINLGNETGIIVECKTHKDSNYDKYSSVSRQLKSYEKLCEDKNLRIAQVLLVAKDFSQNFVDECSYDTTLNTSLITAGGLKLLLSGFKNSKLRQFPVRLLAKGGKLHPERMIDALNR